ncbi:MAG: hypothetical protein AB1540_07705 [Bdellovibrionota bacterium]
MRRLGDVLNLLILVISAPAFGADESSASKCSVALLPPHSPYRTAVALKPGLARGPGEIRIHALETLHKYRGKFRYPVVEELIQRLAKDEISYSDQSFDPYRVEIDRYFSENMAVTRIEIALAVTENMGADRFGLLRQESKSTKIGSQVEDIEKVASNLQDIAASERFKVLEGILPALPPLLHSEAFALVLAMPEKAQRKAYRILRTKIFTDLSLAEDSVLASGDYRFFGPAVRNEVLKELKAPLAVLVAKSEPGQLSLLAQKASAVGIKALARTREGVLRLYQAVRRKPEVAALVLSSVLLKYHDEIQWAFQPAVSPAVDAIVEVAHSAVDQTQGAHILSNFAEANYRRLSAPDLLRLEDAIVWDVKAQGDWFTLKDYPTERKKILDLAARKVAEGLAKDAVKPPSP